MSEQDSPPTRPVIGRPIEDYLASPASTSTRDEANITDDATVAERRRGVGVLFPEIPVDAERQVLGAGLIIGAITFTAFMGWGPIGRWLNGHVSTGKPAAVAAAPKRGSNVSVLVPAVPAVALPNVSAPAVTAPDVTVPAAPEVTLPVVAAETLALPVATEASLTPVTEPTPVAVAPVSETEPTVLDDLAIEPTIAVEVG